MSISSVTSSTTISVSDTSRSGALGAASYATTSDASTDTASSSTQVTISGKAMMLSRMFHTEDPNADPVIQYSSEPIRQSGLVASYLNASDRVFVSKLYEYAQQNGIDPIKVDAYAFDLGCYRSTEHILAYSPADYDLQGKPTARAFNATDEAIAQNIYASKAFNDTEVNHGFLQFMLDPGWDPVHATDFKFLQQVVFAFSSSGSDGSADPNAKPVVRPKTSDFTPLEMPPADSNATSGAALFEKYAHRVEKLKNWLTDDDKSLLGLMYSLAEKKGESEMKKVDGFAGKLVIMHLTEQLISGTMGGAEKGKVKNNAATASRIEPSSSPASRNHS